MTAVHEELGSLQNDPASILSKAFDLLRAFNETDRVMTLSELARAADLPKSTVHRLLARLIKLEMIEHHRYGYHLGLAFIQMSAATPAMGMREVAAPHLSALQRYTGQTVHLAVLRDLEAVFLERFSPRPPDDLIPLIGSRLPASCTAIGKALLAYSDYNALPSRLPRFTQHSIIDPDRLVMQLREVRAVGIASAEQELQLGVSSIATPIVVKGFAVAAISVSYPTGSLSRTKLEHSVRAATRRLTADAEVQAEMRSRWMPIPETAD